MFIETGYLSTLLELSNPDESGLLNSKAVKAGDSYYKHVVPNGTIAKAGAQPATVDTLTAIR